MNAGIDATTGRYVLALNPDCRLEPDFAATLARRLDAADAADVGSASGRLLRAQGRGRSRRRDVLDSTGHRTSRRRAATSTAAPGETRRGPLRARGGDRRDVRAPPASTGARRSRRARISTGYFDADFFLYREDADLALAARRRSAGAASTCPRPSPATAAATCPSGAARCRRSPTCTPSRTGSCCGSTTRRRRRRSRRCVPTLARDLVVLGACLTVERSSLPAFGWLWRNRKRLWAKRREIQAKVRERARRPAPAGEGRVQAPRHPRAEASGCGPDATAIASSPMRIGILGTRGIPARYGGFETLAEELSARPGRARPRRHGVHALALRASRASRRTAARRSACCRRSRRSTSTPSCTARSRASTPRFERFDAVLVCNAINAATSFPPAPLGQDARRPERRRPRAQPPQVERGRASSRTASRSGSRRSIPDADRHGREGDPGLLPGRATASPSVFIPYGGDLPQPAGRGDARPPRSHAGALRPLRLAPRAREQRPRRRARLPRRAGRRAARRRRRRALRRRTTSRSCAPRPIRACSCPGAIYGEGYRELLAHAAVYVQATEVGGTHPALVEAMGYGRVVCYNATPENEEVAGGAALPFDATDPSTLARLLQGILDDPAGHSVWKDRATERTRERYRWDDVVDRYEAVLEGRSAIP